MVASVKKINYVCNSPFNDKVYIMRVSSARFTWNQAREFKDVFAVLFDARVTDNRVDLKRMLKTLGYK